MLLSSFLFWEHVITRPVPKPATIQPQYIQERLIERRRTNVFEHKFTTKIPEKILVIAPHPDDEILCCAQTLREKIKDGAQVSIVYLTDGDAFRRGHFFDSLRYADTRRDESKNAAQKLGLKKSNLYFLGFPDGHLSDLNTKELISAFSGKRTTSTFHTYPRLDYTRPNLHWALEQVFEAVAPDEIYLPSEFKDKHPDHRAAHSLISQVLSSSNLKPKLHTYVVHGRQIPKNTTKNPWKLSLIKIFTSQMHDHYHRTFMEDFARGEERFE